MMEPRSLPPKRDPTRLQALNKIDRQDFVVGILVVCDGFDDLVSETRLRLHDEDTERFLFGLCHGAREGERRVVVLA